MNNTISNKQMPPVAKKAKPASLDRKKARAGWWFVLPFVIGLILIYLPILINSIWYSFNLISMPIATNSDSTSRNGPCRAHPNPHTYP